MISILPVKNKQILDRLYKSLGLKINENSAAVTAKCGDAELGYCLFDLFEKGIIIRYITPENDIMLADGLLRSALHIAAERSAMDAEYADSISETLLLKLDFISDKSRKKLNIDKLFGGCGCKRN